jgi:hypothetical protein
VAGRGFCRHRLVRRDLQFRVDGIGQSDFQRWVEYGPITSRRPACVSEAKNGKVGLILEVPGIDCVRRISSAINVILLSKENACRQDHVNSDAMAMSAPVRRNKNASLVATVSPSSHTVTYGSGRIHLRKLAGVRG